MGGCARMALTTRRLIFLPGVPGWAGRLQAFFYYIPGFNAAALLIWGCPPYISHQEFELQAIERFWTWKPEFSDPPVFQIDTSSWSFGLLTKRRGFTFAPVAEMRQHFLSVEVAWQAAKGVSAG